MAGEIRNSGTWRTISATTVKVAGTWRTGKAVFVKVGGTWHQWFTALFSDTFARTTVGQLGTSSSGGIWQAIKGTWFANGSRAQSNDTPSNNSIAATDMGSPNVTITAQNVSLGTGISFLVVDSNNWWAAVGLENDSTYTYSYTYSAPYTQSYSYTYGVGYTSSTPLGYYATGTSYYYYTAYAPNGTFTTTTTYNFVQTSPAYTIFVHYIYQPDGYHYAVMAYYYTVPASGYTTSSTTTTPNYYSYTALGSSTSYAPYYYGVYYTTGTGYTNSTYTTTGTGTGTTVKYYLNLYKSVAGTVTTVASVALSSILSSLKVQISGTSATATAFSDNAQTTSVGTTTQSLGGTPTATKHGIILTTSAQNQGYTMGYFTSSITG